MHIRQFSPLVGLAAALCACSGPLAGTDAPRPLPVAAADGVGTAPAPGGGGIPSPGPNPAAASDPRDLQVEIMTEAVAALRHELARSYGHSQRLTQQGERLRALVGSLRHEIGKQKRENRALRHRLQVLERRLQEMTTPPPEATSEDVAPSASSHGASPRASTTPGKAPDTPTPPAGAAAPRSPRDAEIAGGQGNRPPAPIVESE